MSSRAGQTRKSLAHSGDAASPPKSAVEALSDELFAPLRGEKNSSLWLGRFSADEIRRSLEKCGFLAALSTRHLHPVVLTMTPVAPFLQSLKLFHHHAEPQHLLAEFRLCEQPLAPQVRRAEGLGTPLPQMLAIEWLMLQNPHAAFTDERPILPGQRFPGLGQARRVLQWLVEIARALQLEGLVNHPEYFHNAYLYRDHFHFYDPEREGMLQALTRDLLRTSLAETSWGVERGHACGADGRVFVWDSDVQILPLSRRLRDYLSTAEYQARVAQACARLHFHWHDEITKLRGQNDAALHL